MRRGTVQAAALCALALGCTASPAREPDLVLDVELDPASRQLSVLAELPRPAGEFRFALHESLALGAAHADTRPLATRSSAARGGLREWSVTLPEAGRLRLEYRGTIAPLDRGIDHRGVLQRLPPMASSGGSFLSAASGWYPAPARLFTYRARISLRGAQKGLVAGTLQSEETTPAAYRASFELDAPADGIDLMAGPYEVREKIVRLAGDKRVRLRTYFFADLASFAQGYLDDSARYLERFSEKIGPYPFNEFSVVASPLPSGFGMPTLTYVGAAVLKLPFIRATSLGHEALHNWWGNGVLVDYSRGNWAEGLTTFMADYAFKEDESSQAAREMRLSWLRDLASLPGGTHIALTEFHSRTHGTDAVVGYGKAAMLFFMLRDAIGDASFEAGIRELWSIHRFDVASWDDLRDAFERASGRSLAPFFAQWLVRRDAPAVRIAAARLTGDALQLRIEQADPPYALRLPVELLLDGGAETRWIEVDRTTQIVTVATDAIPKGVRLDPELRTWRLLDREELPPVLRQWIVASSPRLCVVSRQPELRKAAAGLAERLFESPYRAVSDTTLREAATPRQNGPVLLVGLHADIDAALARLGLPARPASLAGKGSAQVWTVASRGPGIPVAVVSVSDKAALDALLRPLPHYGTQSYLAFDGSRAIERGSWPAAPRIVSVER